MNAPVFISYASKDERLATKICYALEQRQIPCWIAARDVGPGRNFQEAITQVIRSARAMVLVFSNNANNSDEIKKELALAGRHNVAVIPVRIEDALPNDALAYEFATRQWIDLYDDWEHAIGRVSSEVAAMPSAHLFPSPTSPPHSSKQASDPTLPDKPSIAVLPFTNMSDDPDQEFFGDGLAEDVLTELSKLRWLFVISRNSSFTFKSNAVDTKHVSRELGVRYVLEGSVRRAVGRVRVTAQLVDALTGNHIWAERYDRDLSDIFSVQDEITKAVATAIGPAIVDAERLRAVRKHPENLGAWETYQRGLWHMCKHDVAENQIAQSLFHRAIELDSGFAAAYSAVAFTYCMAATVFNSMDYDDGAILAEQFARKAVALDEADADGHARLALALFVNGDHDGGIQEAEFAISLNPNCADGYGVKGATMVFSGRREEGREAIRQFLAASPRDPARPIRLAQIAASYYLDRNYERAEETARQVIRQYPGSVVAYRYLAAAQGQLGKKLAAEAALNSLLALAPSLLERFTAKRPPNLRPDDYEHTVQGLRKAGWQGP